MRARHGLPRSRRLLRPADFQAITRGGDRWRDGYFTVFVRAAPGPETRLGLIVSRRVSPKAVERNRIKRLIRESFRCAQEHMPGLDIVVMAQTQASHTDGGVLRASLAAHWQRASQRCRRP